MNRVEDAKAMEIDEQIQMDRAEDDRDKKQVIKMDEQIDKQG